MASIVYTALRKIITGHTSGSPYSLTFGCKSLLPDGDVNKDEVTSYDNSTLAVLHSISDYWVVATSAIEKDDLEKWEEFFASVAAREIFTFDPYGDGNVLTVELEGKRKISHKGTMHYVYTFTVKVV